jgi:hypothetical protein
LSAELAARGQAETPEQRWLALIGTFTTHRPLWVAQLEAAVQAERSPEVRKHLAEGQRQGREGFGGSLPLALMSGLMLQWLIDPEHAASGAEVAALVSREQW